MSTRSRITAAAVIIVSTLSGALAQAQPAPAAPPASRWPVQVDTAQGTITVFQPQLDDFQGTTLSARAAVSIEVTGQAPIFGAVWIQSRVAVDRVARTVQILDVSITRSRFPDGTPNQDALTDSIRQVFTGHPVTLSLDQLLTMLQTVHQEQAGAAELQTQPPKIIFLDHAAVKVQYDGPPRLTQVPNSTLMQVVNTPFFVVLMPDRKTYYLKGAGLWFSAADPMGPFQSEAQVPQEAIALADSSGYKDPAQALNAEQAASVEIVTASEPTELIWTDGAAQMGTIPGTDLLYIVNTDSDVFLDIDTQQLFVLLSGRWYTAATHDGPWTYVPADKLPADFSRIPPNSDKADVLAHVAGTQAAQDAVADTYIPQTASVNMQQYDQPPIEYDGDPSFQPIAGTEVSYGVNTDGAVVLVGGQYYCCYNGVWYSGINAAGPWQLCLSVPPAIYTIPPSCPIYPVRFCYCYGHTADLAYFGYLPGYVGCFPYDGVVVYGTGYYYSPWLGHDYYPRPWTYGFSARYNAYAGTWGFDFAIGFGGGRSWIGAAPHRWVRSGGEWFGLGGFRPVYRHDLPHQTMAERELAINAAQRDAYGRSVYDHRTDVRQQAVVAARPVEERAGPAVENNVFTDRNGEVYRKTIDGWDQRQQGAWKPAEPVRSEPTPAQRPAAQPRQDFGALNQDYRARVEGDQRSRQDAAPPQAAPREEAPAREAPHESSGGGGERGGGGGGGGRGR